jgi:hypothetical protein
MSGGHILTHRSGIHDFIKEPDFRACSLNPKTKNETLAFIAKRTPDFEPGEKQELQQCRICAFGSYRRKACRQTLSGCVKKRIKLGLKDTYRGIVKTDVRAISPTSSRRSSTESSFRGRASIR